jgi:hypothetical protein
MVPILSNGALNLRDNKNSSQAGLETDHILTNNLANSTQNSISRIQEDSSYSHYENSTRMENPKKNQKYKPFTRQPSEKLTMTLETNVSDYTTRSSFVLVTCHITNPSSTTMATNVHLFLSYYGVILSSGIHNVSVGVIGTGMQYDHNWVVKTKDITKVRLNVTISSNEFLTDSVIHYFEVRSDHTVRVSILDASLSEKPSYFVGNFKVDHSDLFDRLAIDPNISLSYITNNEIRSNSLEEYDILILDNNAPSNLAANQVLDFWEDGGSLICYNTSVVFLTHYGIINNDGESYDTGFKELWFIENKDKTITRHTFRSELHPLTNPFQPLSIPTISSNSFVSCSKSQLELSDNYEEFTLLLNLQTRQSNITGFIYEPEETLGKVLFFGDSNLRLQTSIFLEENEKGPVETTIVFPEVISTKLFAYGECSGYTNPELSLIINHRDSYGFWQELDESIEGESSIELETDWFFSGISFEFALDFDDSDSSSETNLTHGIYYPMGIACNLLKRQWVTLETAYSKTDEVPQGEIGTVEVRIQNDFSDELPIYVVFNNESIDSTPIEYTISPGLQIINVDFNVIENATTGMYSIEIQVYEYLRRDLKTTKSISLTITPVIEAIALDFPTEGIQGENVTLFVTVTSSSMNNETLELRLSHHLFEQDPILFEVSTGTHEYTLTLTVKEDEQAIKRAIQIYVDRYEKMIYNSPVYNFEVNNALEIFFGSTEDYDPNMLFEVPQGEPVTIYLMVNSFSSDKEEISIQLISQSLIIDDEPNKVPISPMVSEFAFDSVFDTNQSVDWGTYHDLQIIISREGQAQIDAFVSGWIKVSRPFDFIENIPNKISIADNSSWKVDFSIQSYKTIDVQMTFNITSQSSDYHYSFQRLIVKEMRTTIYLNFSSINYTRYGDHSLTLQAFWQGEDILNKAILLHYESYIDLQCLPEIPNEPIELNKPFSLNVTINNHLRNGLYLYVNVRGSGGFKNSTIVWQLPKNQTQNFVFLIKQGNFTEDGLQEVTITISTDQKILEQYLLKINIFENNEPRGFLFYFLISLGILLLVLLIIFSSIAIHLKQTDQTFQEFFNNWKKRLNNSFVLMAIRTGKIKRLEKKLNDIDDVLHQSQNEVYRLRSINQSLITEVSFLREELEYQLQQFKVKVNSLLKSQGGIAKIEEVASLTGFEPQRIKFYLEQELLADGFVLARSERKLYDIDVVPKLIIAYLERILNNTPDKSRFLTLTLVKIAKEIDLPLNTIRESISTAISEDKIKAFFCGENKEKIGILRPDQLESLTQEIEELGVLMISKYAKKIKVSAIVSRNLFDYLLFEGAINGDLLDVQEDDPTKAVFITDRKLIHTIDWIDQEEIFRIQKLGNYLDLPTNAVQVILENLLVKKKINGVIVNDRVFMPKESLAEKIAHRIEKKKSQYSFKLSYFRNLYKLSNNDLLSTIKIGKELGTFDVIAIPKNNSLVSIDNYIIRALKNWTNAQSTYENDQLRISCMDSFTTLELCIRAEAAKRFTIDPFPGKYTLSGLKNSQDYLIRSGLINAIFKNKQIADSIHQIRKKRNKVKIGGEITKQELKKHFTVIINALESIDFTYLDKFKEKWTPTAKLDYSSENNY